MRFQRPYSHQGSPDLGVLVGTTGILINYEKKMGAISFWEAITEKSNLRPLIGNTIKRYCFHDYILIYCTSINIVKLNFN